MAETREATKTEKGTAVKTQDMAVSELFTNQVIKEFGKTVSGDLNLTAYHKRLAQHLFIKIDATLKELEKKRLSRDKSGTPIVWANVNMQKLAVDAMHRVELGLDALIPNHISPIPYWNTSAGKYDLDLRIGYVGKDYYKRQMAVEPPEDIIYQLVHKNDVFKPIMKGYKTPLESYEFEIPNPFDRGDVVGGFAYLVYKNTARNKLIIVTDKDFKKAESKAQSKEFWSGYPEDMKYKTVVNRATKYLNVDPEKVNASYLAVERDEDVIDAEVVKQEIEENANKGKILRIDKGQEKEPEETIGTTAEEITQVEQATEGADHQEKQAEQGVQRMPGF